MKPKKKGTDREASRDVSVWQARIRRMKDFQKQYSKDWKRNELLLWGATDDEKFRNNEVAYGWAMIKALETAIYVQNPDMAVEPYDEAKLELANILTSISNYDLDTMDLKSIGNLGLVDNFVCGYFCCVESLETDKREVTDTDKSNKLVVQEQDYEARRVDPRDLLVHPSTTRIDLADCPYLAVATYPTVQELKDDKERYKDLPEDIDEYPEATSRSRFGSGQYEAKAGTYRPGGEQEKDPAFRTICVWEIHNKATHEIIYVTDHKFREIGTIPWVARFKFRKRDLYPVTLMAMHPIPNQFYPKPEISMIANQLRTINKLDHMIYEDAMTKWRKYVVVAESLTPDMSAKLVDPTVPNAVIEVSKDSVEQLAGTGAGVHPFPNLAQLVAALPDPAPKQDLFVVRNLCQQEITDIVGYGPPERGGMPATRSAREAVAIKERTDARLNKRSDAVADFYRLFGAKHLKFLQQTMEIERYVRIFDAARNLTQFRKYSAEDIAGEFNFIVYAGTSAPRSTEAKRSQEIEVFNTLMPLVQAGQIPLEPVILRLATALQWKGVDALLRNPKPAAKQLAMTLAASATGQIKPGTVEEAAAQLVQMVLTPEEIQMLMQGGTPPTVPPPPGRRGDPNANRTAQGAM